MWHHCRPAKALFEVDSREEKSHTRNETQLEKSRESCCYSYSTIDFSFCSEVIYQGKKLLYASMNMKGNILK